MRSTGGWRADDRTAHVTAESREGGVGEEVRKEGIGYRGQGPVRRLFLCKLSPVTSLRQQIFYSQATDFLAIDDDGYRIFQTIILLLLVIWLLIGPEGSLYTSI